MILGPVCAVIPGRDCEKTIGACLDALLAIRDRENSPLDSVIFVDDGSQDGTADIVDLKKVRRIAGPGRGPGAARNLGWRAAEEPLIWFVDSDCIAHPDALDTLLPYFEDPQVGAASGSYGNLNAHSLVATLIHEEIVARHAHMGDRVDFLATFNVVYRRSVLEKLDGFDERFLKAQDAELSFRAQAAGHDLAFDAGSLVDHDHDTRLGSYLHTQRQQGYWRAWLYGKGSGKPRGDSYSGPVDHLQPPLAMIALALALLSWAPGPWLMLCLSCLALLLMLSVPMAIRLCIRTRRPGMLLYIFFSAERALWRGVGLTQGVVVWLAHRKKS